MAWVATAPTPARAHGTLAPPANMAVCTATPSSPVPGSRATIEYVIMSPPDLARPARRCPWQRLCRHCPKIVAGVRRTTLEVPDASGPSGRPEDVRFISKATASYPVERASPHRAGKPAPPDLLAAGAADQPLIHEAE